MCVFNLPLFCFVHLFYGHRLLDAAEQLDLSIGHDGVVKFVAQAGEIAPGGELVIADEVGELMLSLSLVHQLGNEIDAGLHGEDEAGLQRACQA